MVVDTIQVEFNIPYLLEVEDSITQNPEWRFVVPQNSVEAEFRFKKIHTQGAGSEYLRGDRNGLLNRTKVQVYFNEVFYEAIPDRTEEETPTDGTTEFVSLPGEYSEFTIGYTLDYLNRFLEAYRAYTGHHWISHVGLSDIIRFKVTAHHEDGSADTAIYRLGVERIDDSINREMRDGIKNFIKEEHSTNLFKKIDLDAEDNIETRSYDIAVLNSARLLEVWLKTAYIAIMDRREGRGEEAREVVVNTAFISFAKQKFKADIDYDVAALNEFKDWKTNVWEVRNDVIHDGREISEKETAQEAFTATKRLLGVLLSEFGGELEGTNLHAQVNYP